MVPSASNRQNLSMPVDVREERPVDDRCCKDIGLTSQRLVRLAIPVDWFYPKLDQPKGRRTQNMALTRVSSACASSSQSLTCVQRLSPEYIAFATEPKGVASPVRGHCLQEIRLRPKQIDRQV